MTAIMTHAHSNDTCITKEIAIEIAKKEATRIGIDIKSFGIKITKYNTPWNEYIPKDSNEGYYADKLNELKNKEYWAVYFYHYRYQKGGDFCLFIDYNNGNIITIIRWK